MIAAYVPDLMDRSKVASAASDVRFAATPTALVELAVEADLVVIDLSRPGALEAVAALAPGTRSVGFGAHVDGELLAAARAAGCSVVATRREFFAGLSEVLRSDR